jgi:NAD(P)-dependent dehydrogenase (short-subunit alcohol dehydrogenase family)
VKPKTLSFFSPYIILQYYQIRNSHDCPVGSSWSGFITMTRQLCEENIDYSSAALIIMTRCFYYMGQEQDAKVVVNSLHPGGVATNIVRHWYFLQGADMNNTLIA